MGNWRELLKKEMARRGDNWKNIESVSLTNKQLNRGIFNDGFGGAEGEPFTVWTKEYVYSPVVINGQDNVISVPRKFEF